MDAALPMATKQTPSTWRLHRPIRASSATRLVKATGPFEKLGSATLGRRVD